MRRRKHRRTVLVSLVLTVPALAGCGQSSDSLVLPPRPETSATTTAPPRTSLAPATTTPAVPGATTPELSSWVPVTGNLAGLPSDCGTVTMVSAHPSRDMTIVGVADQGLWASFDGSDVWEPLGQGPGSDAVVNRPISIIYDPSSPATFWESGIYGDSGIYRTSDDGAVFTQVGRTEPSDLVAIDFSDPDRQTLLAGSHERTTLFRSTDGGESWTDVSAGLPDDAAFAFAPVVIDSQTHLIGTKTAPTSGVFRTTDGAETWERVFEGGVLGFPLRSQVDGSINWTREGGGAMIRSVDEGATWTELPGPISNRAESLVELPDGRLVTLGDRGLIISVDQGATWDAVGAPIPFDTPPSGFTYSPTRKAFYMWRGECGDQSAVEVVAEDAIIRYPFDYETE